MVSSFTFHEIEACIKLERVWAWRTKEAQVAMDACTVYNMVHFCLGAYIIQYNYI